MDLSALQMSVPLDRETFRSMLSPPHRTTIFIG